MSVAPCLIVGVAVPLCAPLSGRDFFTRFGLIITAENFLDKGGALVDYGLLGGLVLITVKVAFSFNPCLRHFGINRQWLCVPQHDIGPFSPGVSEPTNSSTLNCLAGLIVTMFQGIFLRHIAIHHRLSCFLVESALHFIVV